MALPGNWTGCLAAGACRQVQVNIDVNGALSHRHWQTQRPFQAASLHPNRANSLTVFPACCQCQCLRARGPHRRPELGAAGRHLWGLVRCQCVLINTKLSHNVYILLFASLGFVSADTPPDTWPLSGRRMRVSQFSQLFCHSVRHGPNSYLRASRTAKIAGNTTRGNAATFSASL